MTLNTTYVSNIRRLYQTNVLGSGVVEAHRSITQKRQGYTAYAVCPCVACIRESLFGGSTFLFDVPCGGRLLPCLQHLLCCILGNSC